MNLKALVFNQQRSIQTNSGKSIESVVSFIYFGSEINSTEMYVKNCIAKAWSALNKKNVIWKSDVPDKLKRLSSLATAKMVLMYGESDGH